LGAVRVWTELAEQWKKAGHDVSKFCLTDAFPRKTSSRGLATLRQAWFPERAARYVRRHGRSFDVIDCLIGTLPFSKSQLGFHGLIVARSVGLYRSYEQFIRLTRELWPDQPRGKILGRFFYRLIGARLRLNSARAIRECDVINLPNEEEVKFLQEAALREKPIMVQPYGLSDESRAAFTAAMQSPADRLKQKEICFIGMWGLRKGSRDWPEIIRHIREAIPEAQFKLLGTMADEKTVFNDLHLSGLDRVRCVPTYDPSELPNLLSSCAVGLFPSYIEGFGIAVLEQLASGIPTVAFDVPGPRQIFRADESRLLTSPGSARAMANRAVEILRMEVNQYADLAAKSRAIADQFRWERIAADTIEQYRARLADLNRIVFTEPFGVGSPVGGARILRSLLRDAPVATVCVCTSPEGPTIPYPHEIHVPLRPNFGRIERTRFTGLPHSLAPVFRRRFIKNLNVIYRDARARAVHSIAHGGIDFYHAYQLARRSEIPFFLQVHDDVVYTGAGRVPGQLISKCLKEAWLAADARFVISNELGEEYNRRYGTREFIVVTDGLDQVAPAPRKTSRQMRVYFMGLFHLVYERNVEVLIEALDLIARDATEPHPPSLTLRCGSLGRTLGRNHRLVRVLPFGSQADVERDFGGADILYLPLPFGDEHRAFGAYSLSTKMVTYLGSGLPIIYHGPAGTAAHTLLSKHHAAACVTSLDPKALAQTLSELSQEKLSGTLAANALALARSNFLHSEQHEKFWKRILDRLHQFETAVVRT
jgi:glycosyltransferase involved in cell wall biosynthesis